MTQPTWPPPALAAFVTRWQSAGGVERANYQFFLTELCDLLQVPHPDPSVPDESKNNYVFDRAITATNPDGSTAPNFIDLYRRAHFVLETKQGIDAHDKLGIGILPVSPADRTPAGKARAPSTDEGGSPLVDIPSPKPKKLKKGHGIRGSKLGTTPSSSQKPRPKTMSAPPPTPPVLLVPHVGYSSARVVGNHPFRICNNIRNEGSVHRRRLTLSANHDRTLSPHPAAPYVQLALTHQTPGSRPSVKPPPNTNLLTKYAPPRTS
ncbi:MAG: type IIL restriction-modification enzyme MmeI [Phycisphaerae bacterium]